MYSIYITNTTNNDVYIRFRHCAISGQNGTFHCELEELAAGNDESLYTRSSLNSYLVRWGFSIIPANETMAFAVDLNYYGPRQYASLYALGKLWIMDFEVNCKMYGCLYVKSRIDGVGKRLFYLKQANPQPVWIPGKRGDILPANIISTGSDAFQGKLYFGRSSLNGTRPCQVTTTTVPTQHNVLNTWYSVVDGVQKTSGELLQNSGHAEFIRAKIGDLVPPNAVIGGVIDPEGTLYVGRIGGSTPCAISTENGNIKNFCFYAVEAKQVESGEIMVLTK